MTAPDRTHEHGPEDGPEDVHEETSRPAPLQQGLFFHTAFDSDGQDIYTTQLALDFEGPVDPVLLREVCQALQDRHDSLRSGFRTDTSGAPVRFVVPRVELDWRTADLAGTAPDGREAEAARLVEEERGRRFDTTRPPLVRFLLIRLGETRWRFALTNHHIILDGWSVSILLDELFRLYDAGADGAARPLPAAPRTPPIWTGSPGWNRSGPGMPGPRRSPGSRGRPWWLRGLGARARSSPNG